MMNATRVLPLCAALLSTACVSLDNLPHPRDAGPACDDDCVDARRPEVVEPEEDGGSSGPVDAGVEDTGKPPPPSPDVAPGSLGGACIEEDVLDSYTPLPNSCARGSTCIDDVCSAVPPCAPGVTSACIMPELDSDTDPLIVDGELIYWLDQGELDRGNYPDDSGALRSMTIGEWVPRTVVAGLNFFDATKRLIFPSYLERRGDFLYIESVNGEEFAPGVTAYAFRIADLAAEPIPLQRGAWCFDKDRGYRADEDGVYMHRFSDAPAVEQQVLATRGIVGPCFQSRGHLVYWSGHSLSVHEDWSVTLLDEHIEGRVFHADDTQVISQLRDGYLARATRDAAGVLSAPRSIAGPGMFLAVDAQFIYWKSESAFIRSPLSGVGREDVTGSTLNVGAFFSGSFDGTGASRYGATFQGPEWVFVPNPYVQP